MVRTRQSRLGANHPDITIFRLGEPGLVVIVVDRIEDSEQQGRGYIGPAQFRYADSREIPYPDAHRIAPVVSNAPGIPPAIGRTRLPGDLRQVYGAFPVQREV